MLERIMYEINHLWWHPLDDRRADNTQVTAWMNHYNTLTKGEYLRHK